MKANALETDWLLHYAQNADIANVGDAAGLQNSLAAGSLFVSAHTAFPGEAGAQSTSESVYTGYARQGVVRSSAGWTVSANLVQNAALIQFGNKTGGTDETIFYLGVGRSSSGVGTLDYIVPAASGRFLFTMLDATGNTLRIPGHSFVVNDRIAFFPTAESTLPAGLTAGTVYWVTIVSTDDITVSLTQGGAAVDITATGSGLCFEMVGLLVSNGVNPQLAINALQITED